MRDRLKFLSLAGLVLIAPAARAAEPAPLILISIDAFRADYFDRGQTPTMAMLAKDGVRTTAMHPSFPSLTYPNHYTLVTGLLPEHHGVVGNKMWDLSVSSEEFTMSSKNNADPRWWDGAAPLWVTGQKAGRVVAAAGWPGSEFIIQGVYPNYIDPWRDKRTPEEVMNVALNWLTLPGNLKPSLEFLYLDDIDHAGHDFGAETPQLNAALHRVDAALGLLVAGLKKQGLYDRTNIVIVSDHGMAETTDKNIVVMDDLLDISHVQAVDVGATMGINPLPGHEAEVAKALLRPLSHVACWRKDQIPQHLHFRDNPRIPAIFCVAEVGWRLETRADIAKWTKKHFGEHGYDGRDPHMNALFLAHGPAFRPGITLAPFDNVDVYALLAKISGLKPQKNDGTLATFAPALN